MQHNKSEMITAGYLLDQLDTLQIPDTRRDLQLQRDAIKEEIAVASRDHRSNSARNDRGELLPGIGEVFKEVRLENFGGQEWLSDIMRIKSQNNETSLIAPEATSA